MVTMTRTPGMPGDKFKRTLQELEKSNVRVGWFESSKYADDNQTPVAYVAAINELGPHARPFMRPAAEENDKAWSELMGQVSRRVVAGKMTVEQALEAVGLKCGADIQKKITEVNDPQLSLITLLARKARLDGKKVTGATIGEFAAQIKKDEAGARAEVAGISTKPLNDSGYMLTSVSVSVNNKPPEQV